MMDRSIPWISLGMVCPSLEGLARFALPPEYGWRFFRPGDERVWAEIETSAGEFERPEDGLVKFRRYYPTDAGLDERMIFLTDRGRPFATATAWRGRPGGPDGEGDLQWVSVDAAHQGRGLSRPLVGLALSRMKELGGKSACLNTQTASWVAIKTYHRFGFVPRLRAPGEAEGWKIVSEKTGVDFMKYLL